MRALIGQWAIGSALLAVVLVFARLHDFTGTQAASGVRVGEAAALVVAWGGMAWALARRRRLDVATPHESGGVLVVHATQTGFAADLARRTVEALRAGARAVDAYGIDELGPDALRKATQALFIVSTTGEGDAPDMATGFGREMMRATLDLGGLAYGVLALGDRDYDDYCAFGRELDAWLRANGARPLFDRVEVDNGDEGAVRHWQHHVAQLAGTHDVPDWSRPAYQSWRLAERTLLNPGSLGDPCFHVALTPVDPAHLQWRAGDIVEIGPRRSRDDTGAHPHREYSIASIPADGALHLVVRQQRGGEGELGLGSGWLTAHAGIGDAIDLRVRRNAGFHAPDDGRPVLLIGSGTGIAGLRALLKERLAAGHRRNWLVFGERQEAVDRLHVDELERWRDSGGLERLDLVWSRESPGSHYVQDRLRAAVDDVRRYIDEGASIYVCGSLAGMAPGVDGALRGMLGGASTDRLMTSGRYRRDVY